jgi:endonuclease G, mitochondrial
MSRDFHRARSEPPSRRHSALPGFAVAREMLVRAGIPDEIIEIYFRAVSTFGTRPEVTAVDLGIKLVNSETDADAGYSVRIHVRDKQERRNVPRAQRIPARFEGLRTDVIQAEYIEHLASAVTACSDRKLRQDTLQPGISIGHISGSAGTLGMLVRGARDDVDNVYLLSADHVLADTGNPSAGDPIIQPGREDGGDIADVVAGLTRRSLIYDAAIARYVDDGRRTITNQVAQTSDVIDGFDFPEMGSVLMKAGAVSCVTQAEVTGIGLFEGLGPGYHLKPVANDIESGPIATGGDSGAVWYDPITSRAVGLHVRGNAVSTPHEQFAIATSVVKLCEAMRVEPFV